MPLISLPTISRRAFALAPLGIVMSRAAGESQHWALLSDTHIPANPEEAYRGFKPVENLKRVVPEVVAAKPEGALICGDLARLEGLKPDYEMLKSLVEPVVEKMPLALTLGNHDERRNFLGSFGGTQQGKQTVQGKHVVVVEGPVARFVMLDSLLHPNVTPGQLGRSQRNWLTEYLKTSSDKPTLIVVHHTLDDGDGSLVDFDRLFEIVKPSKKVKAIVYGHSHVYRYDVSDRIHLINLPAIGYNFADTQPVGWVDSTLTAQGGDFTLHAVGGNREKDGKTVSLKWRV
jgi:3',5'-cyclic-AMP phosphodiesterase